MIKNRAIYYGTPKSHMLKAIQAAGFKPIAITIMLVEETFVFQTEQESIDAFNHFKHHPEFSNEGWWYSNKQFVKAWNKYKREFYGNIEDKMPKIYYLN